MGLFSDERESGETTKAVGTGLGRRPCFLIHAGGRKEQGREKNQSTGNFLRRVMYILNLVYL